MYYYYPQFTDEETETQKVHTVSKWLRQDLNPRSLMIAVISQQRWQLPGRCVARYAVGFLSNEKLPKHCKTIR